MLELVHTSVPRGLLDGRSGYTVAAATKSMPPDLMRALEEGSTAAVTRIGDGVEPERFAIYRVWPVTNRWLAVTRIVPLRADHTGRPSRLSHHIVIETESATGPMVASLLADPSAFKDEWTADPQWLEARSSVDPSGSAGEDDGSASLGQLTDHAEEWARWLAERCSVPQQRPLAVLVPAEAPLRAILAGIAFRCKRAASMRIETSTDNLLTAGPSLLLLRDRSAQTKGTQVVADWSSRRGIEPPEPPSAARVPVPRAGSGELRTGILELSGLPEPIAAARQPRYEAHGEREPRTEPQPSPPNVAGTPAEELLCYATGALAGAVAALGAYALLS